MENKKLGVIIIILAILMGFILYTLINKLDDQFIELGCTLNEECSRIESSLNIYHFAFGIVFGILSLGIYLIIFNKGEEAILKRLEEEKKSNIKKEKFNIMLSMLDKYEQKVLRAVKEQRGITQQTLRIRTGLSKAKISQILSDFEAKKIIKREVKGKTYSIYLLGNL